MKQHFFNIFSACLLLVLLSFRTAGSKITVYIIGDSTAANKTASVYPETGWGMALQSFFKSGDVAVDNRALNGKSTESFRADKNSKVGTTTDHWQPVLTNLLPGDYVFIEFGHNDEKVEKPGVGTSLAGFAANLARYVNETRSKKAIPVLMTPIVRRNFQDGVLKDTHGGYPEVVRRVADSLHVPLIDMQLKTEKLLTGLGDTASVKLFNYVPVGDKNYPKGNKDDTHLSPQGAKQIAGLAVQGISELKLALSKFL
jgi:lysophospholipase L1-like esterase